MDTIVITELRLKAKGGRAEVAFVGVLADVNLKSKYLVQGLPLRVISISILTLVCFRRSLL